MECSNKENKILTPCRSIRRLLPLAIVVVFLLIPKNPRNSCSFTSSSKNCLINSTSDEAIVECLRVVEPKKGRLASEVTWIEREHAGFRPIK